MSFRFFITLAGVAALLIGLSSRWPGRQKGFHPPGAAPTASGERCAHFLSVAIERRVPKKQTEEAYGRRTERPWMFRVSRSNGRM